MPADHAPPSTVPAITARASIEPELVKVSKRSNPHAVAGALAGVLRADGAVAVQVVGAAALNQAVKAIAIARDYVAGGGIHLVCVPEFADVEIDGEARTAIRLLVEDQTPAVPSGGELTR